MLDELTPLTGSANDFVFDFDKVAELPTQVASSPHCPCPSLLPHCAHLLVAHFKPACRKLWPYCGCGLQGSRSRAFHTSLNFEQATAHPALPCPTLPCPSPRPHACLYFLHCRTKFSEHTQAEYFHPSLPVCPPSRIHLHHKSIQLNFCASFASTRLKCS